MVANRSEVSSLLSRNLPQPSSSNAMFSTLLPDKSSRHTLNMCKMRWDGMTRNFVRLDRNVIFCKSQDTSNQHFKSEVTCAVWYKTDLAPDSFKLLDHILLALKIPKLFVQLRDIAPVRSDSAIG